MQESETKITHLNTRVNEQEKIVNFIKEELILEQAEVARLYETISALKDQVSDMNSLLSTEKETSIKINQKMEYLQSKNAKLESDLNIICATQSKTPSRITASGNSTVILVAVLISIVVTAVYYQYDLAELWLKYNN
jgi:uncharacterized coiled-coil protein SlyX